VHVLMRVVSACKAAAKSDYSKNCGIRHWVIRKSLLTGYWLRGSLLFTAALSTDSESLNVNYWCLVGVVVDFMYTMLCK
jgi:hypothetical protein